MKARAGIWWFAVLLAWLWPAPAQAHVGSPDVFFEGPAGPYPVRVTIRPPGVVPGLAQIHVRVHAGRPEKVTVLPVRWNAGTKGAPPPDAAKLAPGETNLYTAQLWLMDSGSYSVFVDVSGPQGRGTAIVPLNSLAYQRLRMSRGMAWLFIGLGAFLVALLVSVVGAAVREAVLPAGMTPTKSRRWLALGAMAITLLLSGSVLAFGNQWWDGVDRRFLKNRLYRPRELSAKVETGAAGRPRLVLKLSPGGRRYDSTPLAPDHEKLMHLFLIRQPEGDVFAHLHPNRGGSDDGNVFTTPLPALPPGQYDLYADITHESGLTQTLTNVVKLEGAPAAANPAFADPDDAVDLTAPPAPALRTLEGGFQLKPVLPAPLRANEEVTLRFDLTDAKGAPAALEPYLGMYGHLLIQHADGTVFTHLHPLGTISMTSQRMFAEREHAGYLANQPLELLCAPPSPTLSFPYAFPKPGKYRVWLQTKLQGVIRTLGYTVTVE